MAKKKEETPNVQSVSVVLRELKQCHYSVRYENPHPSAEILTSLYLSRVSYELLGKPKEIQVEIKRVKV